MRSLPTILTFLRIILTPVFLYLFWQDGLTALVAAIVVFTIAALSDTFDGYFARRYGVVSDLGAFLDPIADKFLIGSVLAAFALKGLVGWWVIVLILGRDLLVTGLRMMAIKHGLVLSTTWIAKCKTVVQVVAIYGVFCCLIAQEMDPSELVAARMSLYITWVMYGALAFTTYTGIDYVVKYWRLTR